MLLGPYLLRMKVMRHKNFLFFKLFKNGFTKVADIMLDCRYDLILCTAKWSLNMLFIKICEL